MSGHTKGPWMYTPHGPGIGRTRPTILARTIVVARMPEEYRSNHKIWAEMESNAQLIAAAPEMLEDLKFLVDAAKTEPGMSIYKAHIERAENTIAKAQGKES